MWTEKEKPTKIISHKTADEFYYWLADHSEITNVQGFDLDRKDDGRVTGFKAGITYHWVDINYLWNERKMINDWIDGYLERL